MSRLTSEQILRMFAAFGLAKESERQRFRELERMGEQPQPMPNFILLEDDSRPKSGEDSHAKLA
jgi:hypothetical protein